jgi:hypothetical protein
MIKIMLKSIIFKLFIGIAAFTLLLFSIRGYTGNPNSTELITSHWLSQGPFELSPERGRFALTYSIVEDKSLSYSVNLARFTVPDLGFINGKYVSLFAPGISYLVIPGYVMGKFFGISQVGAFAVISLFAIINAYLIYVIAHKLGASKIAALLGSFIFIFATPAYAYAVTLYQHHISTFLILFSIYLLISTISILPLFLIWFLVAWSIPIDYPNLFLMLPIIIYALRRFYSFLKTKQGVKIFFYPNVLLTFTGVILPLVFFMWFNQTSYHNPFQLAGTLPSVSAIDTSGKPTKPDVVGTETLEKYFNPELQKKSALGFFKTRNLLNGLYIHIFSPDRGIISYTPIIIFGIIGLILLYVRNNQFLPLVLGVAIADLLLYSLWGDPWGGWAFGSRYLIPAYAILAIGLGIAFDWMKKFPLLICFCFIILIYSVWVNTLGAITSSANPPQVQVLSMEKISGREEKYTFMRNAQYLSENGSKSFIFRSFLYKYMNGWTFYYILASILSTIPFILFIKLYRTQKHRKISV